MKSMTQLLKNLIAEESGQDLIEYALVAALVGLGSVASMQSLAGTITNTFSNISTALANA
jgi:pilus assembly protein Flp/PilA